MHFSSSFIIILLLYLHWALHRISYYIQISGTLVRDRQLHWTWQKRFPLFIHILGVVIIITLILIINRNEILLCDLVEWKIILGCHHQPMLNILIWRIIYAVYCIHICVCECECLFWFWLLAMWKAHNEKRSVNNEETIFWGVVHCLFII